MEYFFDCRQDAEGFIRRFDIQSEYSIFQLDTAIWKLFINLD